MQIVKRGLIFSPEGKFLWAKHSALQPTPIMLRDGEIRVYIGLRDELGVSRVGYVDVSADNPSEVLRYSLKPVLDIGMPGAFDDNGVVPAAIVNRGDALFLYYAGYQLLQKARFSVFGGLAISHDGGETFQRYQQTPILERTEEATLFRVIHSIIYDEGVWKVWYGAGSHFVQGKFKSLPVYNIRYLESPDGLSFPSRGEVCIATTGNEHRVGRPYVFKENGLYKMFFGSGTEKVAYRLDYAESYDGVAWKRKSEEVNMPYLPQDFDSQMSCYPAIIKYQEKVYMFYNGNNYGESGFGYAELRY
ncbi:hypothetical protein SCACP_11760 [Sporomusa carbonis]|uniref:hypothetical protein n=1 Tax=Sporomusa carbonis TaxID=3076075 RepID=UPI003A73F8E5